MLEEEHSYIHTYSPCFVRADVRAWHRQSWLVCLSHSGWDQRSIWPRAQVRTKTSRDPRPDHTVLLGSFWFLLLLFASFCFFLVLFGSLLYIQQGSSSFLRFSLSPTPVSHWSLRITTAWREYTEKIHSKFREQDAIFILFADASFRQCRPRDAKSSRSGRYISAIFLSWC